jgi:hypothetical protein
LRVRPRTIPKAPAPTALNAWSIVSETTATLKINNRYRTVVELHGGGHRT